MKISIFGGLAAAHAPYFATHEGVNYVLELPSEESGGDAEVDGSRPCALGKTGARWTCVTNARLK
jgi:hypothetical protein